MPRNGPGDVGLQARVRDERFPWWDPNSEFRPLHAINPLRLEWIDSLAVLAGKVVEREN